jgi:hypothetical protein
VKQAEVKVGGEYFAQINGRIVIVKLESACTYGGWMALNTRTQRRIRIRSAAALRGEHVPGQDTFRSQHKYEIGQVIRVRLSDGQVVPVRVTALLKQGMPLSGAYFMYRIERVQAVQMNLIPEMKPNV